MVDIETTGTRPDRGAIIQIAAVRFDLEIQAVDPNTFNRCLALPPHRFWEEGTRHWWMQQKRHVLQDIFHRMEDPRTVMNDFVNWACEVENPIFWGKPTHFDYTFISSYLHDFDLPNPFSFRMANDMNSFLRARYFPNPVPDLNIPFEGDAHNALWDVFHQIKILFAHVHGEASNAT